MAKSYQLVAWTEQGEVRMIPSLVNECSLPFRERIAELQGRWKEVENEVGWLLAMSRAHENLARFFLNVGRPQEAFEEYKNAAVVCASCSDHLWLQGCSCEFPTFPLLYRFLSMHKRCRELARTNPVIQNRYESSEVKGLYLWFTLDGWETDREFDEAREIRRAWRFGKLG